MKTKTTVYLAGLFILLCCALGWYDTLTQTDSPETPCSILGENYGEINWQCAASK